MPKLQGISHQRAINAFEKAGFWIARQGKHITMTDGEHVITIPRANPINSYTMGAIIKGSGLTIEQFKSLL
jgi:predicted RNA binding protein YcfA (HicA-like mRNA interferase family)